MTSGPPFTIAAAPLASGKFVNRLRTADGQERAVVAFDRLETLWFNSGTLCNLACANCYIESSPTNDALVYLSLAEVTDYLDEIARDALPVREIGITGGEPFMNREIIAIVQLCLERGFAVLMLTNAMRPMRRFEAELLALPHRERLTFRVSLDHYTQAVHEAERGPNSWDKAIDGICWLAANGFRIAIAGRHLAGEDAAMARAGYSALFAGLGICSAQLDCTDPAALVLFPEMDAAADTPEITSACWGILDVDPASMMCASSRMVVRRKGEESARVVACTLLPYDPGFDLGATLTEASRAVALNHPHCSRFCVLGGASCSG